MGNLRVFLVLAVFCAVIGDAVSQNRGSVRYGASASVDEDSDYDKTQPPPARSTFVRRRRPTSTTETPVEETQSLPQERTTGRRVPSRTRFGSQSTSVSHPIEESPAPIVPEVTYDSNPAPPPAPLEDKPQGRRRRPKKRKRPQESSEEKKDIEASARKADIENVNAEPKPLPPSYHGDSESISDPNTYDSSSLSHDNYGANLEDSGRTNAGTQYFPPQSGTNRLPVENTEKIDSSRKYSESPEPAINPDTYNRRYVPSEPASNRGSYVPVLSPNRAPTPEQHSRSRNEGRTRQPSTPQQQRRTQDSRSNLEGVTDSRSHQTQNLRNSQPSTPSRSHSEVRLPQAEQPLVPTEYDRRYNDQPEYASPERVLSELPEDNVHERPQATNRLPNTPEDPYKYTFSYPEENLNNEQDSHTSLPYRRGESEPQYNNDAIIPYSNIIPKDSDDTSKSTADSDEISRYEPPLQRSRTPSQSRKPEEEKPIETPTRNRDSSRSRSQSRTETSPKVRGSQITETTNETPNRQRGTSRYQPDTPMVRDPPNGAPGSSSYSLDSTTRLSGSTRNQPDTSVDQPTRSRGSSRYEPNTSDNQSTRTRGLVRNQPDTTTVNPQDRPTRTRGSTRNQQDTSVGQPTRTRSSVRNQPETSADQSNRIRESNTYTTDASLDAITRTRGSTRNQPNVAPDAPTRTRSPQKPQPDSSVDTSTPTRGGYRYQPDSSIDRPTRTRSSQAEVPRPPRQQNALTNPNDEESDPRLTSQRPPSVPESQPEEDIYSLPQAYPQNVPARREPHAEPDPSPYAFAHPTNRPDERDASDPVRNTLRSRPQYEVRQPEQPSYYEESSEYEQDPNPYVPEYQPPTQEVRTQRIPQREQPRQPATAAPRQQQSDHRSPSRRQPQTQYQEPQKDRVQARQPSRQQTRPRQEPAAPTPSHGRSSSASKFTCPESYGFFADPKQCDKYYECRNGTATDSLCEDGLAFNVDSAPKFLRCDSLRDVDCSSRPDLQEARPTKNCPRRYGLYPNEEDCTKFFNCVDGIATEVQCPPGLTFNDDRATCDWADLVQSSCKTEDLLGFTCPDPSAYDLLDGVYTSYPHPDNCQLHFVCIKGPDGERRPRMLACNEGLVYSPQSAACARPDDVPGCEDFYGSRSPAPKRKPSREPLPTEPEPVDEPEPKPARRRQQPNRRTRN